MVVCFDDLDELSLSQCLVLLSWLNFPVRMLVVVRRGEGIRAVLLPANKFEDY